MLRASRDDCASRDGGQQGSGKAHHAPRNHHGRHGVGYASCADSKRHSDAPLRCPPSDNDIDPQAPSRPSPKGKECTTTSSNTTGMNSLPLGRAGDRLSINSCFCTANGGLFLRPRAAFYTVATAVVMPCMTVGMVETARRKTRFPTVGTAIHAKAKPAATATAFCIYINLL